MRRWLIIAALLCTAIVAAGCGGGSDNGGTSANGVVTLKFWPGQNDIPKQALDTLVARFNATHPHIHISSDSGGVLADEMLTKVTAALASGSYPDIAYIYGSDLANLARSSKVLDLTDTVNRPSFGWNEFWPAERQAATVDGKVRAIPALTDNLAVIYNPKLFDQAGLPYPKADWTWDDYRAIARKLTNAATGTFGAAWPGAGGEDTTWRLWPMLWQQGGDILAPDGKKAAFDSPQGVGALTLVNQMATVDKSIYVDPDPNSEHMQQLFVNGKLGMLIGGPWSLPDMVAAHEKYGVVQMPGYNGDHTTIAGPDNWVIFDNGGARTQAAITFVTWLTDPAQDVVWDRATQSLPLRRTTLASPAYKAYAKTIVGMDLFAKNLVNARARPTIGTYPQISHAVGEAIVGSLLGRTKPADGLKQAEQSANSALSGAPY